MSILFLFFCRMFSLQSANLRNLCLKTTMWFILPHCTVSKNQAERGFWDSIRKVKLWRGTEWRKPSHRHILYQNLLKVWYELLFFKLRSVCWCQFSFLSLCLVEFTWTTTDQNKVRQRNSTSSCQKAKKFYYKYLAFMKKNCFTLEARKFLKVEK